MNAVLSDVGSLAWWRSDNPYFEEELVFAPDESATLKEIASDPPTDASVEDLGFIVDEGPIELLVSSPSCRRETKSISCRLIGVDLPKEAFFKVKNHLYVCSPELLFLLAASHLSFYELVALGLELCGVYRLDPDGGTPKRKQITDVKSIKAFLSKVSRTKGLSRARMALEHVVDNSRSPRESDLYMMLCLPSKLGGFGLGKEVELNKTLRVGTSASSRTAAKEITPDLVWRRWRIALEYESDLWHGGTTADVGLAVIGGRVGNRVSIDSARRRTYEAMSYFCLTVTNDEFVSFDEVCRIARVLAYRMGKHGIRTESRLMYRRSELHDWLRVPQGERKASPVVLF